MEQKSLLTLLKEALGPIREFPGYYMTVARLGAEEGDDPGRLEPDITIRFLADFSESSWGERLGATLDYSTRLTQLGAKGVGSLLTWGRIDMLDKLGPEWLVLDRKAEG